MSAYFWLTLTKSTVYSIYICIWMTLIPMRERYGILFLYTDDSTLCVRDHQLVRKSLSYFVYEDIWFDSIGKHFFFYHFLTKLLRIISFIEIFSSAGICWKEKEKKSGCVLRCWTIPTKFFNGTDACSVEWVWNGTVRDSLKAQRPLLPPPKIPGCGVNFSFTLIHRNNTDTDLTGTVD